MSAESELEARLLESVPFADFVAAKPVVLSQLAQMKAKMSAVEYEVVSRFVHRFLRIDTKEKWERLLKFSVAQLYAAVTTIMEFDESA